jgi:hypothetical protein
MVVPPEMLSGSSIYGTIVDVVSSSLPSLLLELSEEESPLVIFEHFLIRERKADDYVKFCETLSGKRKEGIRV